MEHLTQKDLQKMILFSCEKIEKEKEEINKINVFPVPDQDTGSNMAKTLLGIKEAIDGKEFNNFSEISALILDAAMSSAQGNAGIIYTGFLADFLPELKQNIANAKDLSVAFEKGAKRARDSILNPKQGTILDVIDAAAFTLKKESETEKDIINVLKKVLDNSHQALLETREKMEVLKKANVVDAGGLAFLMILESYVEALDGPYFTKALKDKPSDKIKKFIRNLSNRYEVVSLIENPKFNEKVLKSKMKKLGDSLDIVSIGNKTKFHIHTDFPEKVKEIIEKTGNILKIKTEDMSSEVKGESSLRKVSIGIVTEDASDLPQKIVERYGVEVVKISVDWPNGKKTITGDIYRKMRKAGEKNIKFFPKTSQPSPRSYLAAFEKQLKNFDKVLCINTASKLSACKNSALQAKSMSKDKSKIFIFDSNNITAGQSLLLLKAVELIQEQKEIGEIIKELEKLSLRVHLYAVIEDPKWIRAGGRANKIQTDWITRIQKINLHPVIILKNGLVQKGGMVLARDMAEAVFKKIKKESRGRKIRVIINHADNLEEAKKLKTKLKEIKAEVCYINSASPVICVHTGPGTLIAAWAPLNISK